jgi:hypothetical protein
MMGEHEIQDFQNGDCEEFCRPEAKGGIRTWYTTRTNSTTNLSGGAIAGIVIAAVFAAIGLGGILVYAWKKPTATTSSKAERLDSGYVQAEKVATSTNDTQTKTEEVATSTNNAELKPTEEARSNTDDNDDA